jgi:hypothetical protein
MSYGTENLTPQEQKYCFLITRGIEPEAAVKRVWHKPDVAKVLSNLSLRDDINGAIAFLMEKQRMDLYKSNLEVSFTRSDAHMMYLEAHAKAENASEEIKAIDSMVKLHGLNAPEKVEVNVSSVEQLRTLPDAELARLSGLDIKLDPADYCEVEE